MSVDTYRNHSPSLVRLLVERAEHLACRGRWQDARALFATAMTTDRSPSARIAFGVFLANRELEDEALEQFEKAWEEAKLHNLPEARAVCCLNLSILHRRRHDAALANQFLQLATAAEMESGRFRTEATLSHELLLGFAGLLADEGELDNGLRLLRAAAKTCGNDPLALASIEANIAVTLARLGKTGRALQRLVTAHRLHRDAGDFAGCAHDLVNIGHLLQARSRRAEAHRCFRLAAELFARMGLAHQARLANRFAHEARRIEAIETGDPTSN